MPRRPAGVGRAALCLLFSASAARAADLPAPTMAATRVKSAPEVDGRLDDPVWREAKPQTHFTQNFPDTGRAPSEKTELYVIYDDRALYVGIRCHDTQPDRIVERLTRRDRDTDADKVTVDIDARRDHASAFHFDLNVAGVMADGLRFNENDYNGDWDGIWRGRTSRDPGGWSAEIEIPWRSLRFAGHDPVMGFQVRRYIQRRQEVDEWAPLPRDARAEVSRYGELTGLTGLVPTRLFWLWPYVGAKVQIISNQGSLDSTKALPNAGLDLKLGLTSSLTLDATINPDFGQVEADQVSLNLTTFELFFPEKRPFFLEGVDLFNSQIRQFYTRRVGRSPDAVLLADGEQALDQPATGRIWGAMKISGQLAPHVQVAALDAVTAAQTAEVRPTGGGPVYQRLLDPTANYAVVRARYDIGSSYLGVQGTSVNRFEDRGTDPSPCPNDETPLGPYLTPSGGRCTHDAYTASVDGRFLTKDGTYGGNAQIIYSRVEKGPTRPIADGTTIGPGDQGLGLFLNAGKQNGTLFYFGRYQGFTPKLELNDAGFLRQANVHEAVAGVGVRWTKPIGPTLEGSADVFGFTRFSWAGTLLYGVVGAEGWARLKSFWYLGGFAQWDFGPFYDNRETRDGAILERPGRWEAGLNLKADPRKKVTGELNVYANGVPHGVSWYADARLSLRPVSNVELDLLPRITWTYGDLRWAYETDTLDDGRRRYWFGDLESTAFDVTVRGTYTFIPTLTLQLYAQIFVAGYHYSDFTSVIASGVAPVLKPRDFVGAPSLGYLEDYREGAINLNVLLRWEYRPGSTLIAVYTRAQIQTTYSPTEGEGKPAFGPFQMSPATDVFLLKMSYLWG